MGNSTAGGGRDQIELVEGRVAPVAWAAPDALARLAEDFEGRALPVARSIYFALAELVAEAGVNPVEASRAEVANRAGISRKALDDYVPRLEEAGLTAVERRSNGDGSNRPNVWRLLGGIGTARGRHADDPVHPSSTDTEQIKMNGGGGAGGGSEARADTWFAVLVEHEDVPAEFVEDGVELLRRKTKVDGRIVTPPEMARAAAALAEFNRQADSGLGLGPNLRNVVMRIRERPSWDAAKHVRLVQSAFRIKWWERQGRRRGGRLTPAVIYGNERVFEAVSEDAKDEAKGNTAKVEERRGKFDRKVTR